MVLGSTPHPLPTEPLRNVRSVKTGVPGGDRGAVRERSLARASSLGPNRRTGNRRRGLVREGTRSRRPHRSFARRCGRRGLGGFERLRGPLPVLESARLRRRVLERWVIRGGLRRSASSEPPALGRPPLLRGARLHEAGRRPQGRSAGCRQGSGFADTSAGREKLQKSSGDVGLRSSRGKHRGGRVGLARREEPPRGGPPLRTKGRREPRSKPGSHPERERPTTWGPFLKRKGLRLRVARRWKAPPIGAARDLHGHA